jgi:hypothetical protein
MLNIYLHLLPKLRLSGVMSLLSLYAFLTWTGTTLLVPLILVYRGCEDEQEERRCHQKCVLVA